MLPREEQVKLVASFEDLYKMPNGGLTIEKSADKACIKSGDTVTDRFV